MIPQQISLTEAQVKRLEKEKKDTGLGKSEVIRRAVDMYFDEREAK